ncbi:MAG: ATP-binding cassette domain-containing protein [Oscillospiraceae bacterium]|nr:ATP-binding cassette domain-containing protein [Oscillospiraceae bacterium]
MSAVLNCIGLTHRYSNTKRNALTEFTATFGPGITAILGPNGSGKSTLLNIISCNLKPTKGIVLWNDQVTFRNRKRYLEKIGYVPQQQGLYDTFTGKEFLEYFCALKKIPESAIEDEVKSSISAVNLQNDLDRKIGSYSGGMKQRLLIAQALLGAPELMILDEPTVGLDPKERVKVKEIMKNYALKGKTVILATHIVSDVENIADKVMVLKEGRVCSFDEPEILVRKYGCEGLEEVYMSIFGDV